MISKELLSEVLGKDAYPYDYAQNGRVLRYAFFESINRKRYINIYELAYKCKEWAYKQGFVILSGHSAYSIGLFFCSCKGWLSENYDKQIEINHKTEPEAIFQACQWILDNKD